jgi:hypothetical protein
MRLLDNTLQLNTALFLYDYVDLQLVYFASGSSQVANVGEARGKGIEIDLRWVPNANWDATVGLSFLDTEITDADDIVELEACGDCENNLPFARGQRLGIDIHRPAIRRNVLYDRVRVPKNVRRATTCRTQPSIPGRKSISARYRSDSAWWVTSGWNPFDEYFGNRWENADADNLFGWLVNGWCSTPADAQHHLRDGLGLALSGLCRLEYRVALACGLDRLPGSAEARGDHPRVSRIELPAFSFLGRDHDAAFEKVTELVFRVLDFPFADIACPGAGKKLA